MIPQPADIAHTVMFIAACAGIYDVYMKHFSSFFIGRLTTLWIHLYVSTLCWRLERQQSLNRRSAAFNTRLTLVPVALSQVATICYLMIYILR